MPRVGRGGKRDGAVGSAYANRTDLNQHVPIAAAPDQTYGEASAQIAAQKIVPIAQQVTPAGAPASAAPSAPSVSAAPFQRQPIEPGSLPFLHPTNRPEEPITAGMDFGAGPGSEVMGAAPTTIADSFGAMAQSPHASPLVSALASAARTLGL